MERLRAAPSGGVTAFAIESAGPRVRPPVRAGSALELRQLNQQPTLGVAPCHAAIDASGRWLLVANYGGGVSVLPISATGELGAATHTVGHFGSGPNRSRQGESHPHSVKRDPVTGAVFVPDLGIDQVKAYGLNCETGRLEANQPDDLQLTAGAGPRHMAFHPAGRYAYVANELNSTVTVLARAEPTGKLAPIFSVRTVPHQAPAENYPAEVQVHPSGRFLYVSNRGHDSIGIFGIDEGTGCLDPLGFEPTRGEFPRHFSLDPSGEWLLVANQRTSNMVVFHVEPTGTLSFTGHEVTVPSPVCVLPLSVLPLSARAHRPQS